MKYKYLLLLLAGCVSLSFAGNIKKYEVRQFGIKPNTSKNAAPLLKKLIQNIHNDYQQGDSIVISFDAGTYLIKEKGCFQDTLYISNHDQTNPKNIGIYLKHLENIHIEGNGATLLYDGRILPIAVDNCKNISIRQLHIDALHPQISQVEIKENKGDEGIVFQPLEEVNYTLSKKDQSFQNIGKTWTVQPSTGIAFDPNTKHILFNTSDIYYATKGTQKIGKNLLYAPAWKDKRLPKGTIVAMRAWERPTPGIFLSECTNILLQGVKIHYAEGMGLLAQLCENITLKECGVCLKSDKDKRFFTTQADATHFSSCRGTIISDGGLYEGMMDDAINVHGTYLKITQQLNENTFIAKYMHPQTWGFKWGETGDTIQFIISKTMDMIPQKYVIKDIQPYQHQNIKGCKQWKIMVDKTISLHNIEEGMGVENLSWTPKVRFTNNVIRNNRARGALFSTPQEIIVEHNLFDHTSGSAILLCGDCNGWYETGACRRVIIRNNIFRNALTNLFQFTTAVISIYPEIPDLEHQQHYFHGGIAGSILIEGNRFETFDAPLIYAKSVNGLRIKNNKIITNNDYIPFHPNKYRYLFEKCGKVEVDN